MNNFGEHGSARLYRESSAAADEAGQHGKNLIGELLGMTKCTLRAEFKAACGIGQNAQEDVAAVGGALRAGYRAARGAVRAVGDEFCREDPEVVQFFEHGRKLPSQAVDRIVDFYKTRPLVAGVETLCPPLAIVDALVRGGLHDKKNDKASS